MRRAWKVVLLVSLCIVSGGSLAWGVRHALNSSADLMRRAEEVALFLDGIDPYGDPDMTYPPSAPPVFTALIGPFHGATLRVAWLIANLIALVALGRLIPRLDDEAWPGWLQGAFLLAVLAGKAGRLGIGLGQYHAIPLVLMICCVLLIRRDRPISAGISLGIALVKPTLALPLLVYLAIRRAWVAIASAILLQIALCAVTSLALNVDPIRLTREWVVNARGQQAAGLIDVPSLATNLLHLSGNSASMLGLLTLLLGSWIIGRLRRKSTLALVSLCCGLAAIFTYHRPYDLVLLYPALAYCVEKSNRKELSWGLTAFFAIMMIVPTNPLPTSVRSIVDGAFVATSYAMLGTALWFTIREPDLIPREPPRPSPA